MGTWGFAAPGLALLLTVAACSGGTTTVTCQPQCPTGLHCTATGCVADGLVDAGQPPPDLIGASGCSPACTGATPFCSGGLCVPCLKDGDCPTGQLCKALGSTFACLAGCTDDARCAGGASLCCDGQCSDTSTDPAHCGGCATACAYAHATTSCSGGQCQLAACQAGWGDCNHDPADGCEANLDLDPANCGRCASACRVPNAIAGCSGACYIAACGFGWDDCNGDAADGCEQSVLADLKNCGACGFSCPPAVHAQVGCQNATCLLSACQVGFSDCDGLASNGCEVASGVDLKNCGACGNVCGKDQVCVNGGCTCKVCNIANARTHCVNGNCTFDRCLPGFGDCNHDVSDGCEADLSSDPANCDGCGNACDPSAPICIDSTCTAARLHWTLVESSACDAWCGGQGPPFVCAGPTFTCDMEHLNGFAWIYSPSQVEPPLTIPGNAYGWVSWFCGNDGGCQGPGPNAGNCGGGGPNTVWQCVFN